MRETKLGFLIAAIVCLEVVPLEAHISCDSCGDDFRPSIPPAVMRMPMSARVLGEGVGRSGIDLSYFMQAVQPQPHQYPLDNSGRVYDLGLSTRWGFPGGVEIGGGIDYPFFVPNVMVRIQPFGSAWNYGPFLTLELGANAMPDYHAGISAGAGLGSYFDLHGYYQLGKMLDRDYGEWGAGLTLRSSPIMDIELGLATRTFWGVPMTGDTVRGSLSLVFGSRAGSAAASVEASKAFGGDPAKALDAGDFESAASLYRRELKFDPENQKLWLGYGKALKGLGRDREAAKAFARARKLQEEDEEDKAEGEAPAATAMPGN